MTDSQARIIAGLRLLLKEKQAAVSGIVQSTDKVIKRDVHVWREGLDLAQAAEAHAHKILAAVAEYRATATDLADAMSAVAGASEGR